jgi:hypothetical protein
MAKSADNKENLKSGPVCTKSQNIIYAWAMDAPELTLPKGKQTFIHIFFNQKVCQASEIHNFLINISLMVYSYEFDWFNLI